MPNKMKKNYLFFSRPKIYMYIYIRKQKNHTFLLACATVSFSLNSLINTDLTSCCSCAQIILDAVIHLEFFFLLFGCCCFVRSFFFAWNFALQFLLYVITTFVSARRCFYFFFIFAYCLSCRFFVSKMCEKWERECEERKRSNRRKKNEKKLYKNDVITDSIEDLIEFTVHTQAKQANVSPHF